MAGEHIQVWDGEVGEIRTASTAGGGTALSTTAVLIVPPDGTAHVFLTPTNYSTAKVVKFAFNPFLRILMTTDSFATLANLTDFSALAQNPNAAAGSVVFGALNTKALGSYLLVSSWVPFRGVKFPAPTVANAVASTLLVEYWNGTIWTTLSATDGTAAAGATLAQAGNVTWTVPAAFTSWNRTGGSQTIYNPLPGAGVVPSETPMFHTRWSVSAQLTAGTSVTSMLALCRDTAHYAELLQGQEFSESFAKGPLGMASVEALTDAGTANLIVNAASRYRTMFV